MKLYAVYSPAPVITINSEEHTRHFQGVPYVDVGAEATVTLADGTVMPVPVKTISNTVPPGCETLGQYEIEYEAFGPGCNCCGCQAKASPPLGKRVTATRTVEIGLYLSCCAFACVLLHGTNLTRISSIGT